MMLPYLCMFILYGCKRFFFSSAFSHLLAVGNLLRPRQPAVIQTSEWPDLCLSLPFLLLFCSLFHMHICLTHSVLFASMSPFCIQHVFCHSFSNSFFSFCFLVFSKFTVFLPRSNAGAFLECVHSRGTGYLPSIYKYCSISEFQGGSRECPSTPGKDSKVDKLTFFIKSVPSKIDLENGIFSHYLNTKYVCPVCPDLLICPPLHSKLFIHVSFCLSICICFKPSYIIYSTLWPISWTAHHCIPSGPVFGLVCFHMATRYFAVKTNG